MTLGHLHPSQAKKSHVKTCTSVGASHFYSELKRIFLSSRIVAFFLCLNLCPTRRGFLFFHGYLQISPPRCVALVDTFFQWTFMGHLLPAVRCGSMEEYRGEQAADGFGSTGRNRQILCFNYTAARYCSLSVSSTHFAISYSFISCLGTWMTHRLHIASAVYISAPLTMMQLNLLWQY